MFVSAAGTQGLGTMAKILELSLFCMLQPGLSFMLLPKSIFPCKISTAMSSAPSTNTFTNFHRTLQMAGSGSKMPILWFTLAYEDVPPLSGNGPFGVSMPASMLTIDFFRLLRSDNPNSVGICDLVDLKVYLSRSDL